jgi:hypothetical protein
MKTEHKRIEQSAGVMLALSLLFLLSKIVLMRRKKQIEEINKKLKRYQLSTTLDPVRFKIRKNKVVIANDYSKKHEEIESIRENLNLIFEMRINHIVVLPKKIILEEKKHHSPESIISGSSNDIYMGNSIEGPIQNNSFSTYFAGSTGSGKSTFINYCIESFKKNNPEYRVMIFNFKETDYKLQQNDPGVQFFLMRTVEELRQAIEILTVEIAHPERQKGSLYVFDESPRYISIKTAPKHKKPEVEQLVVILDEIMSVWRSTHAKVIVASQRSQLDAISIPQTNFNVRVYCILDKSMEEVLRPNLKGVKFQKGIWSYQQDGLEPIVLKTYFNKEDENE